MDPLFLHTYIHTSRQIFLHLSKSQIVKLSFKILTFKTTNFSEMASSSNTLASVSHFFPKECTNFLAITDPALATDQFKCFVQLLRNSYVSTALTADPVLYMDVLSEFWTSDVLTYEEKDNSTSSYLHHKRGEDFN